MSDQLDFSLFPESKTDPTIYAEVVIPLALPKNYTWSIPIEMNERVKPGMRVEVVLGKQKKYAGIIKSLTEVGPTSFKPKPILNVLDDAPLIYEQQLRLWQWIASYYMCSEGEVMQAAIPANLKLSSESILIWNEQEDYDVSLLSDEEFLVTEALEMKKELKGQRNKVV
jgi:primosomal protein N' (replication factor Y)